MRDKSVTWVIAVDNKPKKMCFSPDEADEAAKALALKTGKVCEVYACHVIKIATPRPLVFLDTIA